MQALELFQPEELPKLRRPAVRSRTTAQERKRNGQFRAVNKAGDPWLAKMLAALRRYIGEIKCRKIEPHFTFEGFRVYAETHQLQKPASVNAWGALPSAACKAKLCEWTGRVSPGIRPESHGRLLKVWVAL